MKRISIVLCMCLMFMLGACCVQGAEATPEDNIPVKVREINRHGTYWYAYLVVDEETGVNYVCTTQTNHGGVAITPRLNADGTLYVTGGR